MIASPVEEYAAYGRAVGAGERPADPGLMEELRAAVVAAGPRSGDSTPVVLPPIGVKCAVVVGYPRSPPEPGRWPERARLGWSDAL
jgi:hypothetical protein